MPVALDLSASRQSSQYMWTNCQEDFHRTFFSLVRAHSNVLFQNELRSPGARPGSFQFVVANEVSRSCHFLFGLWL